MFKTIARILLLRVLPRRILPIVTVVEALLFLRGIRNRSRVKVNPPTTSRMAPPAGQTVTPPSSSTRI
jgi:hypothetical protein